jgi:3-oxoacyl-[acyl-carrier protein] reductase
LAFAAEGAAVVVNDIDEASAVDTVALVNEAGGQAEPSIGDVRLVADVDATVATAIDRFGGLDVMHANAAISVYREHETIDDETLEAILDVNLKGPLLCARAAIPALRERGGGSILFVSSVQGFLALPGCVTYSATKAGLVVAARTLAVEVGGDGIRVNAIAPGTIDTPMLERDLEPMNRDERGAFMDRVRAANALDRIGRPDEVASLAVFLASDDASYITGACVPVDGGFLAVKRF